jgi:hypothetical protein
MTCIVLCQRNIRTTTCGQCHSTHSGRAGCLDVDFVEASSKFVLKHMPKPQRRVAGAHCACGRRRIAWSGFLGIGCIFVWLSGRCGIGDDCYVGVRVWWVVNRLVICFSSGCVWMEWCAPGVVLELFRVQVIMRRVYMGLTLVLWR